MKALWRLTGWGGAAVLALAAFAITTQTEVGGERLQLALAAPAAPPLAVADLPRQPPEKDAETRGLEAQVRALAADRDRLATRLATLERHLDDITGSIERQAAKPSPAPAPAPLAKAPEPAAQTADVAPTATAPTTTSAAKSPMPPVIDPLAMPPGTEGTGSWPDTGAIRQNAPPLTETKEIVRLPPSRFAAVPTPAHAPSQPPAPRQEFGIELGTAPDIGSLRTRWAVVKANYGPLLAGLQPVAVHDRAAGGKYRLIAGPMANFAAAKEMCTRVATAGGSCRPARFDPNNIVQQ